MTQHSIPRDRQDREIRNAVAKAGSGVFQVRETTGQTLTAGANRVVNFDTAVNNPDGWYDTSTYKFTPKVPGHYEFKVTLFFTAARTNIAYLELTLNGSVAYLLDETNTCQTVSGSGQLYLNGSTDYVQVVCYPVTDNAVLSAAADKNLFSGVLVSTKAS